VGSTIFAIPQTLYCRLAACLFSTTQIEQMTRFTSMTQERRLKKQMEESGREELTRRELIGLILKIRTDFEDPGWDLGFV
jgi:hypothetical protein